MLIPRVVPNYFNLEGGFGPPLFEVHVRERGMYWDDLRALIRRNQVSNSQITYYRDRHNDPEKIGIFDRRLPRRKPEVTEMTGYTEDDHWRDSHVCEAAFFNGEIPIEGSNGLHNGDKWVKKPYRGALATLSMLLDLGCLRRSDDLRQLFARHGRSFPIPSEQGLATYFGNSGNTQESQAIT